MRRILIGLILLGLTAWLPLQAQVASVPELEKEESQYTERYSKFLSKMEESGETFQARDFKNFEDHRTRVDFAQEGFRVFRNQLQRVYIETRYEEFALGLPIVDEMQVFLDDLVCMAASTLKPLSVKRFMKHVRPLYCWLSYLRQALECEDRYSLTYAFEHVSRYNRELRRFYCKRQCWEMTYWKRYYDEYEECRGCA